MNKTMWWGYLHRNDTIQLKRWWGDHEDYTGDCIGNPCVKQVAVPFAADTYEEAFKILEEKLI